MLFRGGTPGDIRHDHAVGAFAITVKDDHPVSRVVGIYDRSPFFGHSVVSGRLPEVGVGRHTLVMWRGPSLGAYSKWFPAQEPHVSVCVVRFDVRDARVTTVTVAGFPKHARPGGVATISRCLT